MFKAGFINLRSILKNRAEYQSDMSHSYYTRHDRRARTKDLIFVLHLMRRKRGKSKKHRIHSSNDSKVPSFASIHSRRGRNSGGINTRNVRAWPGVLSI
jgi:hypothetical protein